MTPKEEGVFADLIGPTALLDAMPEHFGPYLHRVNAGQNLTYEEARNYMWMVLAIEDARQRSAQLGVLLNGLMAKHPTAEEATGASIAIGDPQNQLPARAEAIVSAGLPNWSNRCASASRNRVSVNGW